MKRLLIFITLSTVIVLIYLGPTLLRKFSPIPLLTKSDDKLITTGASVLGFQVTKDKSRILYVTQENDELHVYEWIDKDNKSTQLSSIPITTNTKISFAKSYMDENGNIAFEHAGDLIWIADDKSVKVYKHLSSSLLHTQEELNNKTTSRIFKEIVETYSSQPAISFKMYESSDLTTYLFDIGIGYYIVSNQEVLTLERLPIDEENVLNVKSSDNLRVNYGTRWDSELGKLNTRAVIDTITETLHLLPIRLNAASKYKTTISNLLDDDKIYKITNDNYTGKLQNVCYPNFFVIDGPKCKARRLFLQIGLSEYILANVDQESKDHNYNSSFLYTPYDSRFFTNTGVFIFLSQDYKLYAYKI